jgi:hypothetical protein
MENGAIRCDLQGRLHLSDVRLQSGTESQDDPTRLEHATLAFDPVELLHKRFVIHSLTVDGLDVNLANDSTPLFGFQGRQFQCTMPWTDQPSNPFEAQKQWRLLSPELKVWDQIGRNQQTLDSQIQQASFSHADLVEQTRRVMANPPNYENPLRDAEALRVARTSINELLERISDLQRTLKTVQPEQARYQREAQNVQTADFAAIASFVSPEHEMADSIATEIVDRIVRMELQRLEPYAATVRRIMLLAGKPVAEKNLDGNVISVREARRGIDYRFGHIDEKPEWAIRHASLIGAARTRNREFPFRGVASGLVSDTSKTGRASEVQLMFRSGDDEILATLDHTSTPIAGQPVRQDSIEIESRSPTVGILTVSNRQSARMEIQSSTKQTQLRILNTGDLLSGQISIALSDCKVLLTPPVDGIDSAADLVAAFSRTKILVSNIRFEDDSLVFDTDSALHDKIADYFINQSPSMGVERTALQKKYVQEVSKQLADLDQVTTERVTTLNQKLSQLSDQLNLSSAKLAVKVDQVDQTARFSRKSSSGTVR